MQIFLSREKEMKKVWLLKIPNVPKYIHSFYINSVVTFLAYYEMY